MVVRKRNGPLPPDHPLYGTRIIFWTKRPTPEQFAKLKAQASSAPADTDVVTDNEDQPAPGTPHDP